MDDKISIQQKLFKTLKNLDHSPISFVHLVSELLDISYDSAYRRIRSEKHISLGELAVLASHFHISIDELIHSNGKSLFFQQFSLPQTEDSFQGWLKFIFDELGIISRSKKQQVVYAARDVPIFYYFDFPDIIEFKFYMWKKMLMGASSYQDQLFTFSGNLEPCHYEMGTKILDSYLHIPIKELWNYETFNGILHQVEYAWLSGFFADKNDILRLCHALEEFLHHMQRQVAKGVRFRKGYESGEIDCSFCVYLNEVFLTDNTILIEVDNHKSIIFTYNTLNFIKTHNDVFFNEVKSSLQILIESSVPISGTAAKERNHFFSGLLDKLQRFVEVVKQQ